MTKMRIIGALMFLYGGVMLALLATPARGWALDHSIAELVSWTDRRVANEVNGSVDMPIAIAGSAVVMFAGAWFAVLVPLAFGRQLAGASRRRMTATAPSPTDAASAHPAPTAPRVEV